MKKFIENKYIKNIVTGLFFFASCLAVFASFNMIFNIIGDAFAPLEEYSSYVIVYSLVPAYLFLFYRNQFVRKSNNTWLWVFVIITILSKIFAIFMFSLHFEELFSNFQYHSINYLFPFDIVIIAALEFLVDIYILRKVIKMKGNITYIKYINKKSFWPVTILKGIVLVLAMYYIGAFFNGFYGIKNITYKHGFGYFILMMMFFVPSITICSACSMHRKNGLATKVQVIGFILSLATLIGFITYKSIYPSFEVEVGKPLLEIDFFGSMLIGTSITFVINCLVIIRFIVRAIQQKRRSETI